MAGTDDSLSFSLFNVVTKVDIVGGGGEKFGIQILHFRIVNMGVVAGGFSELPKGLQMVASSAV